MFLGVMPTILRPLAAGITAVTTWSPTDKTAGFLLSNGNRTATANSGGSIGRSTTYKASGLLFAEVTIGPSPNDSAIGFANASAPLSFPNNANSAAFENNGYVYSLGSFVPGGTPTYGAASTVGIAVNMTTRKVFFVVGNVWSSVTGSPSGGSGANAPSGDLAILGYLSGVDSFLLNTGQDPFSNTLPSGYSAWG